MKIMNKIKVFSIMLNAFLVLSAMMMSNNASAQIEYPEDKVSWKFTIVQDGDEATVIGTITMVEHWHIYAANLPDDSFSSPTEFVLTKSSKFKTVGGVIEPKPIFEHDELADENLYYHSDKILMKRKIKVLSEEDFTLSGEFTFQTCDDTHCLRPYTAEFKVKVKGVEPKEEVETPENIEETFTEVNDDEATDKDGVIYVKVSDKWHAVPEGNSTAFYKKYLTLVGDE